MVTVRIWALCLLMQIFFHSLPIYIFSLKKKIVWGKKKANKKQTLLDGYYNEEEISIVPVEVWEEDSLLLGRLSS